MAQKPKKKPLPQRIPRSVLGLCWTLAALHWKFGAAGASQAALVKMLGCADNTVRRLLLYAEKSKVVVVRHAGPQKNTRAAVALKVDTLRELEALLKGA